MAEKAVVHGVAEVHYSPGAPNAGDAADVSNVDSEHGAGRQAGRQGRQARAFVWLNWTTQAIGQQHTSPLRAGCEARRRSFVFLIMFR